MRKTAVLNVVGLTPNLLASSMPGLSAWASKGKAVPIRAVTPAVTCTAQATYYTGVLPDGHGIVANGWYFRDECEIKFWRQSNRLVQAPKVWEAARKIDGTFTCANLFGWYNMYSTADFSVTPRPMYPADGRKLPDIYTHPSGLRAELQSALGTFPLFDFWGPSASIRSTRWIADAARQVVRKHDPVLTLVYLPHLDYGLQRLGPADPALEGDLRLIDDLCLELIAFFESRGARVILLSEYGITRVTHPVHINRVLRENGLVAVREELGLELLDAGASEAFAVADHQVAHIYVRDPGRIAGVRALVESLPGVEQVLGDSGKRKYHLDHPRSGELVAIACPDAWFTYYYWLDDRRAPDFARTVDIHRKPGYDPAELFLDPRLRFPRLRIGLTLARKLLGFRYLMKVIPLDAALVRGSHGRVTDTPGEGPVCVSQQKSLLPDGSIGADEVCGLILCHLTEEVPARIPAG